MKLLNIGRYSDSYYCTLFLGNEYSPNVDSMLELIRSEFNSNKDARVTSSSTDYIGAYTHEDAIYSEIVALLNENGYTEFEPQCMDIGD